MKDRRGSRLKSSGRHHDGVARAVGIALGTGAGGIIVPFTIDEEAILVATGRQFHGDLPETVFFLAEIDWLVLPTGEIRHKFDPIGRRPQPEDDLSGLKGEAVL